MSRRAVTSNQTHASGRAPSPASPPASRRVALRRLAFFALVVGVAALIAWKLGLFALADRATLLATIHRVRQAPLLIPVFIAAYVAAVTFGLPASAFTLAGGVLFGFWRGLLLNWVSAVIGATLAYLFVHALCGTTCRELLGRRAETLEQLASRHGFLGTLRLRLIPLVPFNLLNFAAALSGVRRRDYILATALGIIPGTAIYTYFADSLVQGAAGAGRRALVRLAIAGALLLLLSFVPSIVRRAK